ncbi:glycosyltransferase family 39 protein [Pseudobacteriovorax antillogorgiicola]|uniref:Dolichyl-phosphate-mannose-protein mannosyltransferase n=1 Tax=Pseudobacteriovorax antillogorgiicola TaxID=1513793 RepID=A0A1Y6BK07_9BACT|nr:glycosyltransferase family 39 protein [Pseudobacteriovorax antillogorgiicola]TCS56293.1 dolichyl-phosphate-mannose-protein mannosyltransferase [Pseudobacteriovorax antillogorgiicola]SMF07445.1 Dolichyl-phosphate-mannose-protein mannosyltransferase [Pseudobacteriovorax antillogorgiicola]
MKHSDGTPFQNQVWDERIRRYGFFGITLLGFFLVYTSFPRDIWIDEHWTYEMLLYPSYKEMLGRLATDFHPALYTLCLRAWCHFGVSLESMRLFSVFIAFLTVWVAYRFWCWRKSPIASFIAAILLLSNPLFLRFSQELRGYGMLILASTMSLAITLYLLEDLANRRLQILLGFALAAAVSAKLVGIFLLPCLAVFIVLVKPMQFRDACKGLMIPFFVCLSVFFYWYVFFLELPFREINDWWMPPMSYELIAGTIAYYFGAAPFPDYGFPTWVPSIATVLFCLTLFCPRQGRVGVSLLVACVIYVLGIAVYSALFQQIFWYRSFLPILPLVIAGVIQSTIELKSYRLQRYLLVCYILLAALWIGRAVHPLGSEPVEESKTISSYIENHESSESVVIFFPGYIVGPVRFHANENIKPKMFPLWSYSKNEIQKFIAELPKVGKIFLVIRADLTFDTESYRELMGQLKINFEGIPITRLTILSHDIFFTETYPTLKAIESIEKKNIIERTIITKQPSYSIINGQLR